MGLGPPDHYAVGPLLDDVEIEVRVGLLGRTPGAVALHIGHADGDAQIVVAHVLAEPHDPPVVLGTVVVVHALCGDDGGIQASLPPCLANGGNPQQMRLPVSVVRRRFSRSWAERGCWR